MKAKDYLKKFKEENQEQSYDWRLITAFRQMVIEINDIAKMRNARSDNALIAIFKEQSLKANSFIKMVNEIEDCEKRMGTIRNDAFKMFIELENPDLYKLIW